jgi:hypothetical protein
MGKHKPMKIKYATIIGLVLLGTSLQAQETSKSKWIGTLGVAPVILDGTGIQLGFEKAMNNKLSVGFGFNTLNRKLDLWTAPLGDATFIGGLESKMTKNSTNTMGLNARYYIVGNNENSKFGLYGGLGFGISSSNYSCSYKNLLPETDTSYYSYDYESKERGLSASLTGGLDARVGKGRMFFEIQSVSMLNSTDTRTTSNAKGSMAAQNGSYKLKQQPFLFWEGYLTLGYRLRF